MEAYLACSETLGSLNPFFYSSEMISALSLNVAFGDSGVRTLYLGAEFSNRQHEYGETVVSE